jgi:hypothetical protein
MRRERTLLQHEVDILNQKLTQEVLTLKDELKGMFDDRKMTVRQEQRAMESAVRPSMFHEWPYPCYNALGFLLTYLRFKS